MDENVASIELFRIYINQKDYENGYSDLDSFLAAYEKCKKAIFR